MSRAESLDSVHAELLGEVSLRCCCGWNVTVATEGRLPDPNVASLLMGGHLSSRHPGHIKYDLAVVMTPVYPAPAPKEGP